MQKHQEAFLPLLKSRNLFPQNDITGDKSQRESLIYKEVADITFTIIEEVKEEVKDEIDFD